MGDIEHNGGKRLQADKKFPLGGKIAIIAGAAVIALAVGGYLGLCAYANSSTAILPHVVVGEAIQVGGLTEAQARDKIAAAIAAEFSGRKVTLSYPTDGSAVIHGTAIGVDASGLAMGAYNYGRNIPFIEGGAAYLKAFFGGAKIPATLQFTQEGEKELDGLLANIEDRLTQKLEQTTYKIEESALTLVKGVSGKRLETQNVKNFILQALATGLTQNPISVESAVTVTTPDVPDFAAIYLKVHTEQSDAYFDKATKAVVPSVTGVTFDIPTAESLLESAKEGAVCTVPLTKTEPGMTTQRLTDNLFKDVLAKTVTQASGPSSRWENIRTAANSVNGTILLPGEMFSYTALAGPYTAEKYGKAGAYVNGKTVDTTAGGICQLSSTLYWGTLIANLETVERKPHQFDTGYLPVIGTDATVYGDSPDFKFKNSTEYPVLIECYLDNNHYLHVTIKGTSNGIKGEPFSKVLDTVSVQNKYEPNAAHPLGAAPKRDPERTPYTGKTVEVYLRLVNEAGETVETKFLYKNRYRPRDGVYFYNPADAALWGIDPATGLKTMAPVVPTEPPVTEPATPTAPTEPVVNPDPVETPPPGIPIEGENP